MKTVDKLQKYARKIVGPDNTIWSKTTNSGYFHFKGSIVRVSDHLPTAGSVNGCGATLSIITTSNPDQYVLQQHSTGRLSVISYSQAKEILRSIDAISDIFRYPQTPFRVEKEIMDAKQTVLGEPITSFTEKQRKSIVMMTGNARNRRVLAMAEERKKEKKDEHLQ